MDSLADEAMTTGDKNDVRHVMRYGREKGEGKGEMSGEWERGEGGERVQTFRIYRGYRATLNLGRLYEACSKQHERQYCASPVLVPYINHHPRLDHSPKHSKHSLFHSGVGQQNVHFFVTGSESSDDKRRLRRRGFTSHAYWWFLCSALRQHVLPKARTSITRIRVELPLTFGCNN